MGTQDFASLFFCCFFSFGNPEKKRIFAPFLKYVFFIINLFE